MFYPKTMYGGVSRAISRLASLAARVEYSRTLPSLLACKTRPCFARRPGRVYSGIAFLRDFLKIYLRNSL